MTANPVRNKRSTMMQPVAATRGAASCCWSSPPPGRAAATPDEPAEFDHPSPVRGRGPERRLHRDRRDARRSITTRASGRPASSTSPTRATEPIPTAGRSPSCSTAARARARPISISARSARASCRSDRTGRCPMRRPSWSTIPTIGSTSPTWCSSIRSAPATAAPPASGKRFLGRQRGSGIAGELHRPLSHRGRPAHLAQVSCRRKLRRLPRRKPAPGAGRGPQHRHRRRLPDLARARVQPDRRRRSRAAARRAAAALLRRRAPRTVGHARSPPHWPRSSASPWVPISPRSPPRRATRRRCARSIPRSRASPACPKR